MKTEIRITHAMITTYAPTEHDHLIARNANIGNMYDIREMDGRRVLWHKGHRTVAGIVDVIPLRQESKA